MSLIVLQGLHSAGVPGILSLDIQLSDTSKVVTGTCKILSPICTGLISELLALLISRKSHYYVTNTGKAEIVKCTQTNGLSRITTTQKMQVDKWATAS